MISARIINNSPTSVQNAMEEIGADPNGIRIMKDKALHTLVYLTDVPLKAAIILKQEMLSKGGDAAVSRDVAALKCETTDVLIIGTGRQIKGAAETLQYQPFGLRSLALKLTALIRRYTEPRIPVLYAASADTTILNCIKEPNIGRVLRWEYPGAPPAALEIDGIWLSDAAGSLPSIVRQVYGDPVIIIIEIHPNTDDTLNSDLLNDEGVHILIRGGNIGDVRNSARRILKTGVDSDRIWVAASYRQLGFNTFVDPGDLDIDDAAAVGLAVAGGFTMVSLAAPNAVHVLESLIKSDLGYFS